jgi:hypothetical protein
MYMLLNMLFLCRFSPYDTNLVLREFEKCGEILKHVPGPRDANWMHILYQVCNLLLLELYD